LVVEGRHYPYWDHVIWSGALANFAYLPATARPITFTSAGLPMGIQIIGPYLEDRTPIHAAELMDDLFGGFVRPPRFEENYSEASYDLRDLRKTHMAIELKNLIDEACRRFERRACS
jgi:hypothetical protein